MPSEMEKLEICATGQVGSPKLSEADELFISQVIRKVSPALAARQAFGIKGDYAQLMEFVEAKMRLRPIIVGLARARADLIEQGCLTRAEKRWILSGYARESQDPDVVLKALSLDNKMTGDEVITVREVGVAEYVLRAGDVTEVETPSGGGPPPDEYDGV